ncbi:hypothetical protein O4H29_07085 [Marinobacter salarius]|uniref:DUF7220 family protein n=1 Tax=Marinobacter salarius TaxID=1420917 RepID=UPI0022B0D0CD|nr:hypothetical protein [Marinobacter salarius]MCZ4284598.1 hypothetical protein [Marinobacter salarius]
MKQSRLGSFYEALINVLIRFPIGLVSQFAVFPLVGIEATLTTNFQVAGYFTVISVISSYVIRRWFNGRIHGAAHRMAGGE